MMNVYGITQCKVRPWTTPKRVNLVILRVDRLVIVGFPCPFLFSFRQGRVWSSVRTCAGNPTHGTATVASSSWPLRAPVTRTCAVATGCGALASMALLSETSAERVTRNDANASRKARLGWTLDLLPVCLPNLPGSS